MVSLRVRTCWSFPVLRVSVQVTFKDALSKTERSERVTSELEAKKLGFYLFWNVKAEFDRQGSYLLRAASG